MNGEGATGTSVGGVGGERISWVDASPTNNSLVNEYPLTGNDTLACVPDRYSCDAPDPLREVPFSCPLVECDKFCVAWYQ